MEQVRGNLAATLHDLGEYSQAERELDWLKMAYPKNHKTAAVLAQVKFKLNKFSEAEDAARRAVKLDPSDSYYRVILGEILLIGTRNPLAAAEALERAYDLGFQSKRWYVLMLAACMAADRKGDVAGLLTALEPAQKELQDSIIAETLSIVRQVFGTDNSAENGTFQSQAATGDAETPAPPADSHNGTDPAPRNGPEARADDSDYDPSNHRQGLRDGNTSQFQVRISMVDSSFALDFYLRTDKQDYAKQFIDGYKQTARRFQSRHPTYIERTAGYRFISCEHCGFLILSPRDEGEQINCQVCCERGIVATITSPHLATLLSACMKVFGRPPTPSTQENNMIALLGIWTPPNTDIIAISDRLKASGYELVHRDALAYSACAKEMSDLSSDYRGEPNGVWKIEIPASDAVLGNETPGSVERLIRQLRREFGHLGTCSLILSRGTVLDFLLSNAKGRLDLMHELIGQNTSAETRVSVIKAQLDAGEVEIAKREIAALEATYPGAASTLFARMHVAAHDEQWDIVVNLAQRILEQSPRELGAMIIAAVACERLGRLDEARTFLAAYVANGGS